MPALEPTCLLARVEWLGVVPDRDAALASVARDALPLAFAGPEGEAHGGALRPSCSRVVAQHPKGTPIRNVRQLCVMSTEELAGIAATLGLERFDPAWAGATLVLSGLPDLTHLPPSARLQCEATGTTIVVDMENRPCHLPAPVIEARAPGHGRGFKAAAKDRRGVCAWVEREGVLRVGATMRLHLPAQRAWAGWAALREAAPA